MGSGRPELNLRGRVVAEVINVDGAPFLGGGQGTFRIVHKASPQGSGIQGEVDCADALWVSSCHKLHNWPHLCSISGHVALQVFLFADEGEVICARFIGNQCFALLRILGFRGRQASGIVVLLESFYRKQ